MPIPFLHTPAGFVALVVLAAGCASVPRDAGFSSVEAQVADRAGLAVIDRPEEALLAERTVALLADGLVADEAVQLALLASPGLQAEFASLGIARADLLQAGLLSNPVVEAHIGYPLEDDHAPDLGFGLSMDVLDLLYRPLRRAVAASALDAEQLRVAGAALALASRVRVAYYDLQAAEAHAVLRRQVALASDAALEVAVRLREAGNIREVDLHAEQLAREQALTALDAAESGRLIRRERLQVLLGVDPEEWSVDDRLPDPDPLPTDSAAFTEAVLTASLTLAAGRQEIETLGRQLRATNASALVPALSVGAEAVREGGWEAGPVVALPVPVFDRGQARKAMAAAHLRRRQARYLEQAAQVRAEARIAREALRLAHETASRYREIILPIAGQVTAETQQLYNAMQVGVFQLLDARRQEIEAGTAYLDALHAYHLASTRYNLLLQGGASEAGASTSPSTVPVLPVTRIH
ncbi:MAG: TolC family protein [Rhodothermales bacterium]|nr:TolC family protein [Rhodothermales bacterium]